LPGAPHLVVRQPVTVVARVHHGSAVVLSGDKSTIPLAPAGDNLLQGAQSVPATPPAGGHDMHRH
jgi:hypothetical protein